VLQNSPAGLIADHCFDPWRSDFQRRRADLSAGAAA